MVDWNPYLDSLCNAYTQWWKFGTLKDVVEPKQVESEPSTLPFEFGLMVQTVERDAQQKSKEKQKIERLSVLEGLHKYAPKHVLLEGRPGSGKSTALVRLLVATAQQALQNPHSQIPVLVELRCYKSYYKTSVLDLVQASLKRRRLRLNMETLEELLADGRFLLLMDGINELPDDEARNHIKAFRLDYSDVPMVFTTRDLGVGGDLGIEKKLEMQSLTEAEVEKFVLECMPGGSQQTLQQLRQRLRELGQTPFVMWMLYFIVQKTGTVPSGAGSAFRKFTQLYERSSKDDAPVSDESRRWWSRLLEHLGFEMMQADKPTDFRLTISKREAEDILTNFLDGEKFDKPRDYALRWLEDLLKHHLIQVTSNDQIEFCHQLIQEYYAAEILLQMLVQESSPLNDETLKREYLNYLKWTEPLALMLELVEDEKDKKQALRVVELALDVDWRLGARLAGAVKPELQEQTVGLVVELDVPQLLKIQLLGVTRSDIGIPFLLSALNNEDFDVRYSASDALGNIGSESVVAALLPLLEDRNSSVRIAAISALEEIGTEKVFEALLSALKHEYSDVRQSAASALGKIGSEIALASLVEALNDEESSVRRKAASALGKIGSETAVSALLQALNDEGHWVSESAAYALGEIGSEKAVPALLEALRRDNSTLVKAATTALGQIGSQATIPTLLEALKDENVLVRANAAYALGELRDKAAVPALLEALKDENVLVRTYAASALGELRDKAAALALLETLKDKDAWVRGNAASALGKIGSEEAVPMLLEAMQDENEDSLVRANSAYALGQIGTEAAVTGLFPAVQSPNNRVRKSAVLALDQIGTEAAVVALLSALKDEDSWVRAYAAEALGKIGTEEAFAGLLLALKDTIPSVRRGAIKGLEKIVTEKAVTELLPVLTDADFYVRQDAGYALRRIASSEILPYLNQLLQTTGERHLLDAITAIQERCKFYNYTLTQPSSSPATRKSQSKKRSTQPKSISLMHILHLSDLHFGTLDNANLWSSQLAEDLRNELDIPHLEALILSGDIANYSTENEYKAAEHFLNKLHQQFPLTQEQIIIVPGNHDINWEQAENAYRIERRKNYKGELREGCYIDRGDIIEVRDEQDYKQRFANFSNFYQAIKGEPYPPDYEQQGILYHLTEQNLLILGLNSAWQLDHHYKTRANIHPIALSNALDQISLNQKTYHNCRKISVWHHPIHSTGEDRITDAAFLDRLAVAGFRLFLHGHVHEAKTSNYRYDMNKDGRNLDQICAGTFGAPTKELVTGTPWQYNLLKFEGDKLTVRTRCRRKENGPWEADSIWRQGKGKSSVDFYGIKL